MTNYRDDADDEVRFAKRKDVHLHNGIRYAVRLKDGAERCDWYNCTYNVYNSFDEPEVDYEAEFLDPQQFDETLLTREAIVSDIAREAELRNQVNPQANGPCPVCSEPNGFHNDDMHRKNIDPKYLKEKGWQHADR